MTQLKPSTSSEQPVDNHVLPTRSIIGSTNKEAANQTREEPANMKPEEALLESVTVTNKLVASIDFTNTIEIAFQAAAEQWRQRILELEAQVANLQGVITEMDSTVKKTNALLISLIGGDGKGNDKLKSHVAKWKDLQLGGKKVDSMPLPRPDAPITPSELPTLSGPPNGFGPPPTQPPPPPMNSAPYPPSRTRR